ncbi:MAG: ABC transporter permease [Spirochaetes bacterium]|nr:MAG: ABC transporter permease [Spirochaetota bacterium]
MIRLKKTSEIIINSAGLIITLTVAFLIVVILILLLSSEPVKSIYYFFAGPFINKYYFGNMLNVSIPLIFTGLGIAVAFTSANFNLGGEGQTYAGALITTVVCLWLPQANGYVGGILAIIAAIIGGAFLAGLSGYFKMKWGTSELISSFLISSAVIFIVNYFITGPLDDPSNNLLTTYAISDQYFLMKIFPPSRLDISIVLAVITAILMVFFLFRTHWGYEMRMCGLNREFSRYGGLNVSAYMIFPMLLSGALHGLAGGISILGTYYMCLKDVTAGMGWNGIAVALIAKNNPLAVIPAAVFFAYIDAGAKAAMLHSDVTFEIAAIVQSVIFYLITAQALYTFLKYRKRTA